MDKEKTTGEKLIKAVKIDPKAFEENKKLMEKQENEYRNSLSKPLKEKYDIAKNTYHKNLEKFTNYKQLKEGILDKEKDCFFNPFKHFDDLPIIINTNNLTDKELDEYIRLAGLPSKMLRPHLMINIIHLSFLSALNETKIKTFEEWEKFFVQEPLIKSMEDHKSKIKELKPMELYKLYKDLWKFKIESDKKDDLIYSGIISKFSDSMIEIANEELKEKDKEQKNYFKLPISDVTQSINSLFLIDFTDKDKNTFSSKNRYLEELEANKKNISAKFKDLYSYKLLNLPAQIQTVKLFDFIRITANAQGYNQQICFKTKDYMDYIGSKNIESTFRIIKKHLDKIKSLQILFKGSKKKPAYGFSYIITQAKITYENVWITIIPDILKGISRYITILPLWTGKLDQTGYILLEHICNIANQRRTEISQKGSFNISIKNIIDRLELDEKVMQARYSQFIINPIDKSINEINTISENNSVKIIGNYKKNKQDFNKGFITVELTNEFRDFFTSNIYIKECEIEN